MRRIAIPLSLLALAAAAVPAAGKSDDAKASAKLVRCHRADVQSERFLSVRASMRSYEGVSRMGMRFELRRRPLSGGKWQQVGGPGLGTWNRSEAGVGSYRFIKRIDNLETGTYQVRVRFQWLARGGKVKRSAQRTTQVCRQPGSAPDLVVSSIRMLDGRGEQSRYAVALRNEGASFARPFDVTLRVNGDLQPAGRMTSGLEAGKRGTVEFVAPSCRPGTELVAAADPDNRIPEAGEQNNTRAIACPLNG